MEKKRKQSMKPKKEKIPGKKQRKTKKKRKRKKNKKEETKENQQIRRKTEEKQRTERTKAKRGKCAGPYLLRQRLVVLLCRSRRHIVFAKNSRPAPSQLGQDVARPGHMIQFNLGTPHTSKQNALF